LMKMARKQATRSPKPSPLGAPDYIPTTDSTQHTPVSERTKWNLGLVTGNSRRGATPKPLFSTRQSNRFVSIGIPGELVAGRLDSTLVRHQLTFYHGPLTETNSVTWLVKAA